MERKIFLKNGILLLGSGSLLLDACKKTSTTNGGSGITENCITTANEV